MVDTTTKLPIRTASGSPSKAARPAWHPFEDLRRDVDRLFQDFGRGTWLSPSRPDPFEPLFGAQGWNAPAVDITEKDKVHEITAELPGVDAKDVEVTLRDGSIVIRGEKHESKEEKSKDYYVQERQYGSFERCFALPEGIDRDKVEANFANGVLTVTLPKTADAQKSERKVAVKAA